MESLILTNFSKTPLSASTPFSSMYSLDSMAAGIPNLQHKAPLKLTFFKVTVRKLPSISPTIKSHIHLTTLEATLAKLDHLEFVKEFSQVSALLER